MREAPDNPLPPILGAFALVASVAGSSLAVIGGLMVGVGSGSLLPPTPGMARVPLVILLVGLTLFGIGMAVGGGRFLPWIAQRVPRMFPFAPTWVNAGLYLTLVIGATTVFHGTFDVISGAHNGGQVSSFQDQDDLTWLLIGGSAVVWILTAYTVLLIARIVRVGRGLDAAHGSDPYGRVPTFQDRLPPIPRIPAHRFPGAPAGPLVIFAVTWILLAGISASIQILEVNIGPAPVLEWLGSLAVLPAWAVATTAGIAYIDRGIRQLERMHVDAAGRSAPITAADTPGERPASGFIQ